MQLQYSSPSQATTPALGYVIGRRFVALLIDVIMLGIFQYLILMGISAMGLHASGNKTPTQGDAYDMFVYWLSHLDTYSVLLIVVITIIPLVYFTVMEAVQGATVGKMVLGIRVVKLDGSDIGWSQAIVRNLLRIVDELPPAIPYLLGGVLILNSSRRQRLGDRFAGTVVVRRRSGTSLHTSL
jgi:uncharacterized RDD family membrane protein YckC